MRAMGGVVCRPLAGEFGGAGFAEDGDADLAWVLEVFFDLLGDVAGKSHGAKVVDFAWVDDDADFASGLDGEGLSDAFEGGGDFFKAAEAFDVAFDGFAPRAGSSAGDGVGHLDDDGFDGAEFDFVVVGFDAVGDVFGEFEASGKVAADDGVGAFDFVVDGLADIVEERAASGGFDVGAHFVGDHGGDVRGFDGVTELILSAGGTEA